MIDDALQTMLAPRETRRQAVDYDEGIDVLRVIAARDDGRIKLVDHSWLDGEPGANPLDAKQGRPPLDLQDELASFWIEDRPQGGAWLVPARDKGPEAELTRRAGTPSEIAAAVSRASRLVHLGRRAEDVLPGLEAGAGPRVARAAAAVLRDDEGLAGRVFIREAAFPGLRQGRWDKVVKRLAQQARYLVSPVPADGFRKFGLEVVAEVPWAEALKSFEPHLRARGVRTGGDPKEVLRAALASDPEMRPASRRVPAADPAPSRVAVMPGPVKSPEQVDQEADGRMARRLVRLAVRRGRLTEAEADKMLSGKLGAREIYAELDRRAALPTPTGEYRGEGDRYGSEQQAVRNMSLRPSEAARAPKNLAAAKLRKRVARMLVQGTLSAVDARRILSIPSEAPSYGGDGVHFDPRRQAARDLALPRFSGGEELQERLAQRRRLNAEVPRDDSPGKLRKRVAQMLLRGEVGPDQARQILANQDGWGALARYLASPGRLPQVGPPQSVVKPYGGHVHRAGGSYKVAQVLEPTAEERATERAAQAAGCAPADVTRYVRWLSAAAARGLSAEVLEHEASLRFAEPIRRAARGLAGAALGGIHDRLREREQGEVPGHLPDPHENAFIPDAGWNPGGSR